MGVTYIIASQSWLSLGSHPSWSTLERRRPLLVCSVAPTAGAWWRLPPLARPLSSAAWHIQRCLEPRRTRRKARGPFPGLPPTQPFLP